MNEEGCPSTSEKMTYRVGDDQDVGLGGSLGGGLGEVTDNGGIGVEEIVTGHTGLAGDTGGDEDDLGALESITETLGGRVVAVDGAVGVDVAQIGRDTWKTSRLGWSRKLDDDANIPGPPRIS